MMITHWLFSSNHDLSEGLTTSDRSLVDCARCLREMKKEDARPVMSNWIVETCHMVCHPEGYEAEDHFELYRQVQDTANHKKIRIDRPPIGQLEFKPVENEYNQVVVVHAFFRGQDGTKRRFMRLRRVFEKPITPTSIPWIK